MANIDKTPVAVVKMQYFFGKKNPWLQYPIKSENSNRNIEIY